LRTLYDDQLYDRSAQRSPQVDDDYDPRSSGTTGAPRFQDTFRTPLSQDFGRSATTWTLFCIFRTDSRITQEHYSRAD